MPDQLTDRSRKAAEEIYAWPRHWPQEREYRIITDEERLSAYADIIDRHWREHIESEKKLIRSGETPDGCKGTGDCECNGKCYECDYFDDQHFVIRRDSMHKTQCFPRSAPPKGQGGMDENGPPSTVFLTGTHERRRISREMDIMLEMRALDAEMKGMEEFNRDRIEKGYSPGYDADSFFTLAEKYRKLKEAAPCPEK